jgi:hypothetical protein
MQRAALEKQYYCAGMRRFGTQKHAVKIIGYRINKSYGLQSACKPNPGRGRRMKTKMQQMGLTELRQIRNSTKMSLECFDQLRMTQHIVQPDCGGKNSFRRYKGRTRCHFSS